jgi:uncharacterized tellurite resistance protein B-like protein
MLKNILKIFNAETPVILEHNDARLAITALMIRVARSDNDFSEAEFLNIKKLASQRFELNIEETDKLIEEAKALEEQAPDTVRFTKSIKEAVAFEDRSALVEDLWAIVLTDDYRDANEDALIRTVVSLLGVSDKESALARQRVSLK